MAQCPACDAAVEPNDRFCRSCGTSLASRCATCDSPLPPGAETCASCGAPIRPGAHGLEHRLVTALYVDLVGSTRLAEELDAENLATIVGTVQARIRQEIEERQGSVGAFVGDGVLGVFGLPVAHEDDPDRALRSARSILTAIADLSSGIGRRLGVTLQARAGLNTGDLLAPAGDVDLGTLAGDVLNVAARLQEGAAPGEVVVSERTARSAPRFRFDDLGVLDVRGRARPIHAFRMAGEVEERPFALHGPFLGREEALRSLQHAFKRVTAQGRPHHVVVIGDAGVGKSRLVREFVDWAGGIDPSLTALSGRCLPYGEDITYRPLSEMINELTGITATAETDDARRRIEALVGPHLTGLDDDEDGEITEALLRMIGLEGGSGPSPRRTRELLRAAWRSLLSGLADDGPVIVVVEDVHWAGGALLDVLDHVVRRAAGPLLLLTPSRPEVFTVRPQWRAEEIEKVLVTPLKDGDARRLAGRLLAEAGLPVREHPAIAERADGNPFFIEELVRQLALRRADTSHHDDSSELPATIQGVISARIDLLAPQERRVLQAASIMGRIFWPSAVAHLTGLDDESIGRSLDRLEAMHMVRIDLRSTLEGETEYLFQHSLIGEAAYGRLSRIDLARMHSTLAEWLADRHVSDRPELAERLAFHTAKAHSAAEATEGFPPGEVEALRIRAFDRLLAASTRAREQAAFGRALELAEDALETASGPHEAWRAHEQIGLTHLAEYDGDAAWESLTTAIRLCERSDHPPAGALARLAAAAVESPLRWTATMRELPPRDETLRIVRLGLNHAGTDDSEALASLLTAIAFVPFAPGRDNGEAMTPDEARSAALRAREMARRLKSPAAELAALDALMNHSLNTGRIQRAAATMTERLELVEEVADPREVGDTYAMAAWLAFDLGDYPASRDHGDRGFARTIDDAPSVALHTLAWSAQARVQTGEWDQVAGALSTAGELLDPASLDRPPLYAAPLFAAAAMVAEFRGRKGEADRLLDVLTDAWASSDLAAADDHPHARWTKQIGPIYLRRGELEVVDRLIATGSTRRIGREGDRLAVACDLVEARQKWSKADEIVARARSTGSAYGLQALQAFADRLEGSASLATGDARGGRLLLEKARDHFAALGDRWEEHRTTLLIAAAGGEADIEAAAVFFETIGAVEELGSAVRLAG